MFLKDIYKEVVKHHLHVEFYEYLQVFQKRHMNARQTDYYQVSIKYEGNLVLRITCLILCMYLKFHHVHYCL